jgi:TRAP-type C4-dicarboxylate transport system substrate-binding protein
MPVPSGRRSLIQRCAAAGGLVLARPRRASAAMRTLRLAHIGTDGSHFGQGARAFATAVAADPVLSASLRIEMRGNSELGDNMSLLRQCAAGSVDLIICPGTVVGNLVPQVAVLGAPFLFRDVAHARAALDSRLGEPLAAAMPQYGLCLLAWGENGLRHITANRAIRGPADLAGLKIRLVQSEVMLRGFRALGAAPEIGSFMRLRDDLRAGRFEAEENPIVVIEGAHLYDLQSTLSLTGHAYDPAAFLVSADVMEGLSAPQREALAACGLRGAAVTRAVAAAAQRSGTQRLAAVGMTIVADVDTASLRAAARPYLESLGPAFGADLVRGLLAAGS